ncbi:MAG: rod shape-determining protein MreC [Candidatus Dadabacteria bacterium]|nr:MAG: rod shape-determining protein MreC [Candidatus Dadabacteria bacterium]
MRRNRSWRRVIVGTVGALLLLQVLNLVMPARIAPVGPFNLLVRMFLSMSQGIESAAEGGGQIVRRYFANADAQRRLEDLQRRYDALAFAHAELRRELENRQQFEALLGWPWEPWQGVLGQVVYQNPSDRYRSLWIRVPDGANVVGHAVVDATGLVGRITRQAGPYAEVLLVSDVESAVDAITDSGIRVIVRGSGHADGRLDFVPRYEPLLPGDRLTTTGRDAAYPPGIPVATVLTVERDPEQVYLRSDVRFVAALDQSRWVRTIPVDAGSVFQSLGQKIQ